MVMMVIIFQQEDGYMTIAAAIVASQDYKKVGYRIDGACCE